MTNRNDRRTWTRAAILLALAGAPAAWAQNDPFGDPTKLRDTGGDDIRNPLGSPDDDLADGVKVDENLLVDLHVNDEDLASVLQMLSIQSQRNIVTSNKVSAAVTANLYGVTFYEALDAILHVNGYGYIERGNFIFVYTLEEIMQLEEQARQRTWAVLTLNFLNATDAAEFVTPLLSDGGQIKTNGKVSDFTMPDNAPVGAEEFANASTLVIHDYPENIDAIKALLKEIDDRPTQFLVEATVLQTALNEANAYGVDFSVIAGMEFTDFVGGGLGPLKLVDGMINGRGSQLSGGAATPVRVPVDGDGFGLTSTPGNVSSGRSTVKIGVVDDDISAFLRLLDEVTDTTIISRPTILTLNRMPARVLVGRKVGYLQTTSTDTSTTQTVEFLDTGTQLNVRPFLVGDGLIRMELKPQVSEAVIREATDATGAAVTIPDEITNELTANVLVRDGQTIMLGGLFRESTSVARRQVPGLGDIPWVGAAFRGNDDEIKRDEIIFMIKTSIMADNALADQGARAESYIADARTGAREGLLFFGREKRCQQYNLEAERFIEQGKLKEALYCLDRSLALNAMQPEAIRMRERLLADEVFWPSRSIMDDIISGEVDAKLQSVPPGGISQADAEAAAAKAAASAAAKAAADAARQAKKKSKPAPAQANAEPSSDFLEAPTPQPEPIPSNPEPTLDSGSTEPQPAVEEPIGGEPASEEPTLSDEPTFPDEPTLSEEPALESEPALDEGERDLSAEPTLDEVETDPGAGAATSESDGLQANSFGEVPDESAEGGQPAADPFAGLIEGEASGAEADEPPMIDTEPQPRVVRGGFFSFHGFWSFFHSLDARPSTLTNADSNP